MGVFDDKIREIIRLEEQYRDECGKVMDAIKDVVRGVGQNPALTPVGEKCFTLRLSDIIDAPWSPQFHDWEKQAELLLEILAKKPIKTWAEQIESLIAATTNRRSKTWQVSRVDKIQLNRKFLMEVQKRL